MVSCSDSTPNAAEQSGVPDLPPAKSMGMDLSIFASGQPDSSAAGNHNNYEAAASSISTIQSVMSRNVNLIQNLFEQADTAEAEELSSTKWQWKYTNDEQEGGLIYEVRLVAEQQSADEIKWDLFLSSSVLQQNEEKHYLSGTTNSAVTEGVWTYYSFGRAGQPSQEMAKLDWQRDDQQNISMQLRRLAGNNFEDSQMKYSTEGPIRTIILAPEKAGKTTIEFNTETNFGYIIAPDYNNGDKACWNSNFKDVDCSEINL